jgi:alpha-L-rhamnosidase
MLAAILVGASFAVPAAASVTSIDPTASIARPVLESSLHQPLPEQYLAVASKGPWYLERRFTLLSIPQAVTLYVAARNGDDQAHVRAYLNGVLVADSGVDSPPGKTLVVIRDIRRFLRRGSNRIVLQAAGTTGVAAKILPRPRGLSAPAIVITDSKWTANAAISQLGSVESYENLLANDDANMYLWPGYDGISPYLARAPFAPARIFSAPDTPAGAHGSAIVVDLGRETVGRIHITSGSDSPIRVALQYGESLGEALNGPYLGTNELRVPPHASVYGPKSAFRFARLAFLDGSTRRDLQSISVDAIYYPVRYRGSFESSDPLLNRIWAVGAYTAHLCMQDTIWDAPKRDRLPWSGDLNVSGLVIDSVFSDRFLMRKTLSALIRGAGNPLDSDVNGIPGYSAFWVMNLADYYRYTADLAYVRSERSALSALLAYMRSELGSDDLFANTHKAWAYVDWAPGFDGDTPQAREATTFEFYRAFVEGATLLRAAGDADDAQRYETLAAAMQSAAQTKWLDPQNSAALVTPLQTGAMAIFSGVADSMQRQAIWQGSISKPGSNLATPYYNFYIISAMAMAGERPAALNWIRTYWGGMIAEGATSFWEAYDPRWPKSDFHRYLQADNGEGYYVSLSHGWASGPTAWLMQQVLGINPTAAGFSSVTIRPDLAGLAWARGTQPTPHGNIAVSYREQPGFRAQITLPFGVSARVSMPLRAPGASIFVNGKPVAATPDENGMRRVVQLVGPGRYELSSS